uniref:Uncharacterized protein n=1 Tax=Anguilla anguilla TaxID=7936 RepID=A0A0E9S7D6_ANGAN
MRTRTNTHTHTGCMTSRGNPHKRDQLPVSATSVCKRYSGITQSMKISRNITPYVMDS